VIGGLYDRPGWQSQGSRHVDTRAVCGAAFSSRPSIGQSNRTSCGGTPTQPAPVVRGGGIYGRGLARDTPARCREWCAWGSWVSSQIHCLVAWHTHGLVMVTDQAERPKVGLTFVWVLVIVRPVSRRVSTLNTVMVSGRAVVASYPFVSGTIPSIVASIMNSSVATRHLISVERTGQGQSFSSAITATQPVAILSFNNYESSETLAC
jgi:hypothetical protein